MSSRVQLREKILQGLQSYEEDYGAISGLVDEPSREAFIEQLVESIHRVQYVKIMKMRGVSSKRTDPGQKDYFDPLLAAIYQQGQANIDEAFWLTFLFTYFGKSTGDGWRYSREFYGKLGQGGQWDWVSVSSGPGTVESWIDQNLDQLSRPGCRFGNHRKYESWSRTGRAVQSYVDWIGPSRQHSSSIADKVRNAGGNQIRAFDLLYRSMDSVYSFGRMAKFDYLAMVGKLGLVDISPGSAYVVGSTGPREGGKLFFGDPYMKSRDIDARLIILSNYLGVGLQEMEDSICNWQKSPQKFVAFRG